MDPAIKRSLAPTAREFFAEIVKRAGDLRSQRLFALNGQAII